MGKSANGCRIIVKIGDETKTFYSDRELDDYLYNHRETLLPMLEGKIDKTFSSIEDGVTKANVQMKEVVDFGKKVKHAATAGTRYDPKYVAVTHFIQNAGLPSNWRKPIVGWKQDQKFTYDELKEKDQLTGEGQKIQAAIEDDNIINNSTAADFGTDFHSLVEKIILGLPKEEVLTGTKLMHTFGNTFMEEMYNKAYTLVENVKAKHEGATFYTEATVAAKELNPEIQDIIRTIDRNLGAEYTGIVGTIDLVVIDKEGLVHLYDWKTSVREFDDWSNSKLRHVNSQLGIYAAILEQYGLNVASLNVGALRTILDDNVKDRVKYVNVEFDGIKPIYSNELVNNAKLMIPSFRKFATENMNNVNQNVEKVYSGMQINDDRYLQTTVEAFINKDTGRVRKVQPGTPWAESGNEFYFHKDRIVVKDGQSVVLAKNEEDLRAKVEAYIKELNEVRQVETALLAKNLRLVMRTRDIEGLEKISNAISTQFGKTIYNRFYKYVKQGWSLNMNEVLLANNILVFTRGSRSEVVILDNGDLNSDIKLTKGTTILGNKIADRFVDDQFILKSKLGNILLMKAMIFVAEHVDYFSKVPIENITVCSLHGKDAISIIPPILLQNYEKLRIYHRDARLKYIPENVFQKMETIGLRRAFDYLEISEEGVKKYLNLGTAKEAETHTLDELRDLIHEMVKYYPQLKRYSEEMSPTDPVLIAYGELLNAYSYLMGEYHTMRESDRGLYLNGGWNLDGLMLVPNALANSANVRKFDLAMNAFSVRIANEFQKKVAFPWQKHMQKLSKDWDISLTGGEWRRFKNWFEEDENGNIHSSFALKDPDTHPYFQEPGKENEKAACKFFLETINSYRSPEQQEDSYFNVPLIRAGLLEMLAEGQDRVTIIKELFKNWSDPIREGLLGASDNSMKFLKNSDVNELWNPMLGLSSEVRENALSKGTEYFEKNLDIILLSTMAWAVKCEAARLFLPVFNMFRVSLLVNNKNNDAKMTEIYEHLTKYIKANVFNHNIIPDSLQSAHKILSFAKSIVGKVALGLSFKSFFRENLSSALNATVNQLAAKGLEGTIFSDFNKELYLDAMATMSAKLIEGQGAINDIVHQLNAVFRMSDFGFSQMSETTKSNRYGLLNLTSGDLYLTSSLPDFYHRNAILIMKLKTIGAWDAYSLNEDGELTYDWYKDKQFDIFQKYKKESDVPAAERQKYYAQRDLYTVSLAEWKALGLEEWTKLEFGDPLPHALAPFQQKTLKTQADILFGNYDQESKAMITRTFLGSLFFQFKTYGYARLLTWIKSGSATNVLRREPLLMINDAGHLEQMVAITNEEGTERIYKFISEVTDEEWKTGRAQPCFEFKGGWMEGKFSSMLNVASAIVSGDPERIKAELNDSVNVYNLRVAFWDTFIISVVASLIALLFGEEKITSMSEQDWITRWSYNVLMGVTQDGPFWEVARSMYSEGTLPLLTSMKRYMDNAYSVMMGNSRFLPTMVSTFGATSELSNYFKY